MGARRGVADQMGIVEHQTDLIGRKRRESLDQGVDQTFTQIFWIRAERLRYASREVQRVVVSRFATEPVVDSNWRESVFDQHLDQSGGLAESRAGGNNRDLSIEPFPQLLLHNGPRDGSATCVWRDESKWS